MVMGSKRNIFRVTTWAFGHQGVSSATHIRPPGLPTAVRDPPEKVRGQCTVAKYADGYHAHVYQ